VRELPLGLAATLSVTVPSPVPEAGLTVIQEAPLDAVQSQPAVAVTATLDVPAPAATESVVGAAENEHAVPAWVTVMVWPATVAVPVRALALELAATLSVTAPSPLPEAGLTVIHDALLVAVQAQPPGAVTATLEVPASASTDSVVGAAENVHARPAWVIVTVCPATVTVPVRALVSGLAATVSVTGPPPLPDAGLTVIQGAALDAVQPQPEGAVTVTVEAPPPAATENVVGAAENVHATPACVTVTDCPATVTVPVREPAPALAAIVTVTDALPLPEVGLTVIHDSPLDVVQPQPDGVVTATVDALAPAATESVAGEAENVHSAPAWVTVTVRPAAVIVPARELALGFAAIVSTTEPSPLPDAGLTVIHDAPLDAVHPHPDGAVMATLDVPASAPTDSDVGAAVNVQDVPDWVTVTASPPIVTMPVRALMLEFAAIVNVTDPLPLPDAGLTVIHDTLLVAVHPQPAGVVTPTEAVLAPSPTDSVIGEIANVQATPACVTVTVCPATLTVPVRELVLEFAAIVSVTDPFPLPDAGLTVIHAALLDAVQAQPAGAVTLTLDVPAPAATDSVVGDAENVQATPACVTVTVCPATVAVPVRELVLEFAAIVSVTDPLPLPDVGLTVIHAALLEAVHPQPAGLVTPTEAVLAPSSTDSVVGEAENVQGTPACVTVTVCPATVAVPVRELVLEFAAIVSVTDPFPLPDAGLTVIHDALLDAVQAQPDGAVTLTLDVPAPAATDSVVGDAENVQGTPACVTVTVCPATVTVPVRELVLEFAAMVSVTDPFPLPDAGLTVIHAAPLEAVQAQPAGAVTLTLDVPAPAATDSVVGDAENVQGTPACVTVTVCPATVTVPVRELVLEFAAIVSVTDPFPLPDAGLTVIHDAPLDAVQAQPVVVTTVTDEVPAPAATLSVVGEMLKVQPPSSIVNWFESALRPVPLGPTAATRDS
jgi:hypothetical protein